jgi:hypothetical protein
MKKIQFYFLNNDAFLQAATLKSTEKGFSINENIEII